MAPPRAPHRGRLGNRTGYTDECAPSPRTKEVVQDRAVRITLVRHGESVANRVQRWQGQGDSPLSDLGRQQAEQVGQRLRHAVFDRVISSDLSRARDTALATGHRFETDPTWREFDVGAWEGLTREEVNERYPEEMARLKAGEDIPMGGGESYGSFSARIDRALGKLRSELAPGQHALVVCHGGVIGTLIAGALGLRGRSRWPFGRASNTSVSHVSIDGDHAELHAYNDASHLLPLAMWPQRDDGAACIALVADADPDAAQGVFVERYDARERSKGALSALDALLDAHPDADAQSLAELVSAAVLALKERHAEQRVAVALRGHHIRAFVEDTLWLGGARTGGLRAPPLGSVSHVTVNDGKPALLDYAAQPASGERR